MTAHAATSRERFRERVATVAMLVATALYLIVELAFNYSLVNNLGSIDLERDRITPAALSGMAEMGRILCATMITLLLLGGMASDWVARRQPFPLWPLQWLWARARRRAMPRRDWGLFTFALAGGLLAGLWWLAHTFEDRLFEFEAWTASPQRRQELHIALNATKMALVAAKLAGEPPFGRIKPVAVDVRDRCLAATAARPDTVLIDQAFLEQPGAQPLVAAMPHLLALRWETDATSTLEEHCEVAARWQSLIPSADQSYAQLVAPAMRSLELAFDPAAPRRAGIGPLLLTEADLKQRLRPNLLPLDNAGLDPDAVARCLQPLGRLTYPGLRCLWAAALAMARDQGRAAGRDYRAAYLERRQKLIDLSLARIDSEVDSWRQNPDDFNRLDRDQKAMLLGEIRQQARQNPCLIQLDVVEESVPDSLSGIRNCRALFAKIKDNAKAAAKTRWKLLGGREWFERGGDSQAAIDYRKIGQSPACETNLDSGAPADQCRTTIMEQIERVADDKRREVRSFTTEPRAGMLAGLEASRLDPDRTEGDPGLWPEDIRLKLTAAANRAIAARLADRPELARALRLTAMDDLLRCRPDEAALDSFIVPRLESSDDQDTARQALAGLDICAAYSAVIAAAGRRAEEHADALPEIRAAVRSAIVSSLRSLGVAEGSAQTMAHSWIDDSWRPETEVDFARRIERGIVNDLLRPRVITSLASTTRLDEATAAELLDRPVSDLAGLLAVPAVNARLREELKLLLDGGFAYAGLPDDAVGRVRLTRPIGIVWQTQWQDDIHRPLLTGLRQSVLGSRMVGQTDEYVSSHPTARDFLAYQWLELRHWLGKLLDTASPAIGPDHGAAPPVAVTEMHIRHGRCYTAGHQSFYAARLPTLGLTISVAGIALHSGKLLFTVMKLFGIGLARRALEWLAVFVAMLLVPSLTMPKVIQSPLAQALLVNATPDLRIAIAAQSAYRGISGMAHQFMANYVWWDLEALATPESKQLSERTADQIEADPRIERLKRDWSEVKTRLAGNSQLRDFRKLLVEQFLCDPAAPRLQTTKT